MSTAAQPAARALVVAYDFPPHAAVGTQRTLRVVRALAENAWSVRVLTGDPSGFHAATPVDPDLLSWVPPGVQVLRARTRRPVERLQGAVRRTRRSDAAPRTGGPQGRAASARPTLIRRCVDLIDALSTIPDGEAGWILPAIVTGLRSASRPDVIYSSGPPWSGHLVAGVLASALRTRWVADFRDPWARAPWRSARTSRFGNAAAARLERIVVSRADAVVFTTAAARDEYEHHYPAFADRFFLVPNGCDPSLFDGVRVTERDEFVLLHAGSLYGGRNPVPVMRAIARGIADGRLDRGRFRLRLVGAVSLADLDLARTIDALQLRDVVELVPRMGHRESLGEIASASALLLLQPGTNMSIPAKLYEYFAAGRPVLAITESGEIGAVVKGSAAGLCVRPGDEEATVAALAALANGTADLRRADAAVYDGRQRANETLLILRRTILGDSRTTHRGGVAAETIAGRDNL